jgi:hypothetical protein
LPYLGGIEQIAESLFHGYAAHRVHRPETSVEYFDVSYVAATIILAAINVPVTFILQRTWSYRVATRAT